MNKLIVVIPADEVYRRAAEAVIEAQPLALTDSEVVRDPAEDWSPPSGALVVSIGRNALTDRLLEAETGGHGGPPLQPLTEDGYVIRNRQWAEETGGHGDPPLLVLAVGGRQRSDFYAAFHFAEIAHEIGSGEGAIARLRELDIAEKPAFSERMLLRWLPGFYVYDPAKPHDDALRAEMEQASLKLLERRYNVAQQRLMGMDVAVDFEAIGFPEVYGDDPEFKAKWQARIADYATRMKELIDIHHRYDLKINSCQVMIGFAENWINENFFKAHPEAMAVAKPDPPSINWGQGWLNRWCPSHPLTWEFLESYVADYFKQFDLDELEIHVGDVYGVLNCGCDRCKQFPYHERMRKLFETVYRIMKEHRPNCVLIHRDLCYADYYPGREKEMQDYLLEGLPDTATIIHWGSPQCFDVCHDWRAFYQQPMIGYPRLSLTLGMEWHLHPPDRIAVQVPQVYKEQLMFAARNGVYGLHNNYMHDQDAFFWLQWEPRSLDSLWFEEDPTGELMPWHFDHEAVVACMWNPYTFDPDRFWEKWLRKHFGDAWEPVYRAFRPSIRILETLGMWDIGEFAGRGLPPFSYMDRVFRDDRLEEMAQKLWIDPATVRKQTLYPREPEGYDASDVAAQMVTELEAALGLVSSQQSAVSDQLSTLHSPLSTLHDTLRRWVRYARGTYHACRGFAIYHEAYFLNRSGRRHEALAKLREARAEYEAFDIVDYRISCQETEHYRRYCLEEIDFQISQLEQGVEEEFDVRRYAKVMGLDVEAQGWVRDEKGEWRAGSSE